ncbi:WGxxGxxG family protein [Gorillibacterium sp. CAU 1737]|uniref:WGxxGxxG family protein n=1 Tax=Gorillibacterium sp. CAU 1737 TaxID=3140362 RepID=UPI0032618C3E
MKKKVAMVALLSLTLATSGSVYANANTMTGNQSTNQGYTGTATNDAMRSNTNYSSYGTNNYNGYSNNGTAANNNTNRYRAAATDNDNDNWGWLGLLGLLGLAGMRNRSGEKH